MPDLEQAIHSLTGVTAELVREHRELVQGLNSDRGVFRETLRDLSGFVATAGVVLERMDRQVERLGAQMERLELQMERLAQQVGRLAEITEAGLTRMALAFEETHRLIAENNQRIEETNAVIRRLLDILARGRGNGEGPPAEAGL
ncbi:MAG: hypothetical protein HYU51_10790 [Candidatus Rokubacteria bacterium]|nr:hypothetical protein [Candidatus Rokubacteria bacterium]